MYARPAISRVKPRSRALLPAAGGGGGDAQRLAVFRDRAPRDFDALGFQQRHDAVVGQDFVRLLVQNEFLDAVAHGFGRVRLG